MRDVVVPGEADQPADALGRRSVEQRQLLFGVADAGVRVLQHGEEQRVLAAEVVVQHPLVRLGARRNAVDARAAKAVTGELLRGCREDRRLRAFAVADGAAALAGGEPAGEALRIGALLTGWLIECNAESAVGSRATDITEQAFGG